MKQKMTDKQKRQKEIGDKILELFRDGKEFDGEDLCVILGYVMAIILKDVIKQNDFPSAMQWWESFKDVTLHSVGVKKEN